MAAWAASDDSEWKDLDNNRELDASTLNTMRRSFCRFWDEHEAGFTAMWKSLSHRQRRNLLREASPNILDSPLDARHEINGTPVGGLAELIPEVTLSHCLENEGDGLLSLMRDRAKYGGDGGLEGWQLGDGKLRPFGPEDCDDFVHTLQAMIDMSDTQRFLWWPFEPPTSEQEKKETIWRRSSTRMYHTHARGRRLFHRFAMQGQRAVYELTDEGRDAEANDPFLLPNNPSTDFNCARVGFAVAYQSPPIYALSMQRTAAVYGLLAGCADEYEVEWLHLSVSGSVNNAALFGVEGLSGLEYDRLFVDHLEQIGELVRGCRASDLHTTLQKAEVSRQMGNASIQAGEYTSAVAAYDEAAALLGPFESDSAAAWAFILCLSNRAEARLRLRQYCAARDDCADASLLLSRRKSGFDPAKAEAIGAKVAQREAAASKGEREAAAFATKEAQERLKAERKAIDRSMASRVSEAKAKAKELEKARKAELKAHRDARGKEEARERLEKLEAAAREAAQREERAREESARAARQLEAELREEQLRREQQAAQRERVMARRRLDRSERRALRIEAQEQERAAVAAERQAMLDRAAWADRENAERDARLAREAAEADEIALVTSLSLHEGSLRRRQRASSAAVVQPTGQHTSVAPPGPVMPSASESDDAAPAPLLAEVMAIDDDLEAEQCAICYEDESFGQLLEICPNGHICHLSCLSNWRSLQRSGKLNKGCPQEPTCPVCRQCI